MTIKDKLILNGATFSKRFVSGFIGSLLVLMQFNVFELSIENLTAALNIGIMSSMLIVLWLLCANEGEEYNKVKMSILSGTNVCGAYYMCTHAYFVEPVVAGVIAGGIAMLLSHIKRRYFWW